ncbi:efflux RND transporter periplasmic adaptor subunit [Luteibacter sp. dw_328]|uniref:efflux RND transporter periplasmic adaptor subunit n=1 Tax=Luteibacter sp. dw_328 TaxID=2719796 RepID=UPI001BD6A3F9|nr:efflux RND transporter periplasmic adaptor subunit [Luteibacter sp. dw_328]
MHARHSAPRSIPLLIGVLLLAGVLSGCSRTEADPRLTAPLVRTATLDASKAGESSFSGIVAARVQSNLGFRVPGKVIERLVDAGQTVRKGQPLMRMDRTDLALADTASVGQVEAARAQALQTAADEKRLRGLVDAGAVSASAYDQAKAASDAAAARLRAAEAQASVSSNEAGYSILLADADGTVMETLAEPGQVVAAGQMVVRLAHAGPREALVDLPETVRPAIGSTARATLYGGNGEGGSARLRLLSDAADPATRTFEARYVLEGAAADAPLGSTVVVHLPNASRAAMSIPISAIFDRGNGPGVWVIPAKTQAVSWRPVTLGSVGEESVTVTGGLQGGERFVALGAHQLHEGEQVRTSLTPGAQP